MDEEIKKQPKPNSEAEKTEFGLIAPQTIESEMEKSYLDYAMSVIVSRALPDVRDGDRKSTRLNFSHVSESRMPSSA